MKKLNGVKNQLKALWNDESAQGATEYILLLVIVVTIVIMFGPKIRSMVNDKLADLQSGMGQVNTGGSQ